MPHGTASQTTSSQTSTRVASTPPRGQGKHVLRRTRPERNGCLLRPGCGG
jgi:hypothetical protein